MIFKMMTVADLKMLHKKINKNLLVRFPKNDNQTFIYNGVTTIRENLVLFNERKSLYTSSPELLVAMNWETYQLHKIVDEADYKLAIGVYEQYFHSPLLSEEGCFAYLLGLTIQGYEAEHYPIASISTVDFIDSLLEERKQSWDDILSILDCHPSCSVDLLKLSLDPKVITVCDIEKISQFFALPVQAFIVGGYNG